MEVTCSRCGTDYEFEETLISQRGTTVKCTGCGHLFKVFQHDDPGADQDPPPAWSVRLQSGKIERLDSLESLTRRITEGLYQRNDEISRSGADWQRLGEVDELESFFDDARRSTRPPAMPPPVTVDGIFTPGAMISTCSPRLENSGIPSFWSIADTAIASS